MLIAFGFLIILNYFGSPRIKFAKQIKPSSNLKSSVSEIYLKTPETQLIYYQLKFKGRQV